VPVWRSAALMARTARVALAANWASLAQCVADGDDGHDGQGGIDGKIAQDRREAYSLWVTKMEFSLAGVMYTPTAS
jgi:hypothetical protein